jgi:hypothetical protein
MIWIYSCCWLYCLYISCVTFSRGKKKTQNQPKGKKHKTMSRKKRKYYFSRDNDETVAAAVGNWFCKNFHVDSFLPSRRKKKSRQKSQPKCRHQLKKPKSQSTSNTPFHFTCDVRRQYNEVLTDSQRRHNNKRKNRVQH